VTTTPPALYLALLRSRRLRPTPLFRIETIRNTKSTPRALQTLRFGFRHLPFPPINTASVRFSTRLHCCFRLVFIVNNFPFCNVLVRRPAHRSGNGSADLKGFILLTRNQEPAAHILVIHLSTDGQHKYDEDIACVHRYLSYNHYHEFFQISLPFQHDLTPKHHLWYDHVIQSKLPAFIIIIHHIN